MERSAIRDNPTRLRDSPGFRFAPSGLRSWRRLNAPSLLADRDLTQLFVEIGRFAGAQANTFGRLLAGIEVGVSHGAVEVDPVALFEDLRCIEFGMKVDPAAGHQKIFFARSPQHSPKLLSRPSPHFLHLRHPLPAALIAPL